MVASKLYNIFRFNCVGELGRVNLKMVNVLSAAHKINFVNNYFLSVIVAQKKCYKCKTLSINDRARFTKNNPSY